MTLTGTVGFGTLRALVGVVVGTVAGILTAADVVVLVADAVVVAGLAVVVLARLGAVVGRDDVVPIPGAVIFVVFVIVIGAALVVVGTGGLVDGIVLVLGIVLVHGIVLVDGIVLDLGIVLVVEAVLVVGVLAVGLTDVVLDVAVPGGTDPVRVEADDGWPVGFAVAVLSWVFEVADKAADGPEPLVEAPTAVGALVAVDLTSGDVGVVDVGVADLGVADMEVADMEVADVEVPRTWTTGSEARFATPSAGPAETKPLPTGPTSAAATATKAPPPNRSAGTAGCDVLYAAGMRVINGAAKSFTVNASETPNHCSTFRPTLVRWTISPICQSSR